MTTDAAKQAEQFNVAPCTFCGPNFIGTCPHRTSLAEQFHAEPQLDGMRNAGQLPRDQFADHLALLPSQPTVIATHVVDLTPLIRYFESELSRLRDQLAAERGAASSAREALAASEERAKLEREGRLAALGEANRYAVERDNARAELERYKATMGSATTVPAALVPGTVDAVIEAYRLLVGDSLRWDQQSGWHDESRCDSDTMEAATVNLILWLDVYYRDGRP